MLTCGRGGTIVECGGGKREQEKEAAYLRPWNTFESDEYVHYLDYGDGFMGTYIC